MKATNNTSSFSYLLIGSGRVARHLAHYFNLLNIQFESWDRSQDPHALSRKIQVATHILIAISDRAIEGFYRQHLAGLDKTVVHFSGANHFEGLIAAHPLMTFGNELYTLDFYKQIYFVLTDADNLSTVLPGLPNLFSVLEAQNKARYHAHCVLGGNFVTLLVGKMLTTFEQLNIPNEAARPYVEKIIENTFNNPTTALTGPIARRDGKTVDMNLNALQRDPYLIIYEAFLKAHWPDFSQKR